MADRRRKSIYRAAFAHRDYRWLMAAFAQSAVGDFIYGVTLVAVVWTETRSATWVTATVVLTRLPQAVLPPFAGALADRLERRRLLVVLDLGRGAVMVAMAVVAATSAPIGLLIGLAVVASTLSTPVGPANVGLLPELVPARDLAAANAVAATIDSIALLAGPVIGAALLVLGQPAAALAVNAATFFVSAACLTQVRRGGTRGARGAHAAADGGDGPPEDDGDGAGVRGGVAGGVRAVLADRPLALVTGGVIAACFTLGVTNVLFVLVSVEQLGTGSAGLGYLLAATGVGGLIGSQISDRLAGGARIGRSTAGCLVLVGASVGALAVVDVPVLAYALTAVFGGAYLVLEILGVTLMQRVLDGSVLGRATGAVDSAAFGAVLLGSLVGGPVAATAGLGWALAVAAMVPLVLGVATALLSRDLDRQSAARLQELRPRVAVLEQVSALAGADRAGLERLAAAAVEEQVPVGVAVVTEGEPAQDFYVVARGRLRVDTTAPVAGGVPPALSAGDFFGEIGLLESRPRTATVTAVDDGLVYRIPGADFLDVVRGTPAVASSFGDVVTSRLARTHRPAGV